MLGEEMGKDKEAKSANEGTASEHTANALAGFLLGVATSWFVSKSVNAHPLSPGEPIPQVTVPQANNLAPHYSERNRKRWYKRFRTYVFVVNLFTLVAVAWYAFITHDMWKEMQRQTKTAQDQLEQSQRHWIKILDVQPQGNFPIVGGLSFEKIGPYKELPDLQVQANLQIDVSFTNIGHSVADVNPSAELFAPLFSTSEYWNRISAEEQRFCSSPSVSAVTAQKVTVFPNEPQPFVWHAGISTPLRKENINHSEYGSGITPALIVCVSYRHKGLSNLYQTRALYEISHKGTGNRFFNFGGCNLSPFNDARFIFCEGWATAKLLKFDRNNMGDDAY
jgi:hypothetical protein